MQSFNYFFGLVMDVTAIGVCGFETLTGSLVQGVLAEFGTLN